MTDVFAGVLEVDVENVEDGDFVLVARLFVDVLALVLLREAGKEESRSAVSGSIG